MTMICLYFGCMHGLTANLVTCNHAAMRYTVPPDNVLEDLLTEAEYDNAPNRRAMLKRARARAWAAHRASGPTGRLRELALGALGDSVLFTEYTRSSQLSALMGAMALEESVQFTSRVERSLVDGSIVGVRVMLVGFTR